MGELTSRERLIKTFKGEETDRIPTYDILHNKDLIEFATGQKITPENAEDLLCKTANKYLDLIRHFTVPDYEGEKIIREDDGFIYRYEWWTGCILERPVLKTVDDVRRMVEKDIEIIKDCTLNKKICYVANNHVNLFYEKFEYFEEICAEYERITEKLNGTVMLGPEMIMAHSAAFFRYGFDLWTFFINDYPEIAREYINSFYSYNIAMADSYIELDTMPIVCTAGSIGTDDRLLYNPDFYKEVIIPEEIKLYKKFKSRGKYIIAFLDGYKLPILNDFINAGVDAIDPFEPYCKMNVKKFREEYPDVVICQPIDCTQLLPFGSENEVRDATIKAIEDAGKKKILIGSSSEIHPNIKISNAIIMYETARNYIL